MRRGACNSSRGAKRLVADAVKQAGRLLGSGRRVLVRMDSAYYGRGAVHAALAGGAAVSVTVRMNAQIKGRDRCDRRRGVDHDRVHRRGLRRGVQNVGLPGRARRDRHHRVRWTEEVRSGARSTCGAQDPGLQRRREGRSRSGRCVRHVAVPRVLHHRRAGDPRHHRRGQDPPRSRDHRAGPRRHQRLRAGPQALGGVHRQRSLAGAGRDGVQPHPRRRQPHGHRRTPGPSSSTGSQTHWGPSRPDHPAAREAPPRTPRNTRTARSGRAGMHRTASTRHHPDQKIAAEPIGGSGLRRESDRQCSVPTTDTDRPLRAWQTRGAGDRPVRIQRRSAETRRQRRVSAA